MHILDLLYPKRCVGCCRLGAYFCHSCRKRIGYILQDETICPMCIKPAISGITHPTCQTRHALNGLTSFFHYSGVIKRAIKSIKYRYVYDIVREMMSLTGNKWIEELFLHAYQFVIVPVPLHPQRKRERGFNQAELIGRCLEKELKMRMDASLLTRRRYTTPQVEMTDRKKRLNNMEGVFEISVSNNTLRNLNVLLVDDVFTTGATLRSASGALKKAGAKYIWGITMAR